MVGYPSGIDPPGQERSDEAARAREAKLDWQFAIIMVMTGISTVCGIISIILAWPRVD